MADACPALIRPPGRPRKNALGNCQAIVGWLPDGNPHFKCERPSSFDFAGKSYCILHGHKAKLNYTVRAMQDVVKEALPMSDEETDGRLGEAIGAVMLILDEIGEEVYDA